MIEAPAERSSYLDDWEYVIDSSIYEASSGQDVSRQSHWWVLNANNSKDKTINLLIKVSFTQTFNDSAIRNIINDWYNLDKKTFYNKYEIKEPQINTVYGVVNDMGFFEYKIYYQDYGWYNIIFPNIDRNDYTIAHAKVPVYGMIDYRTNILKKTWFK